MSLKKDIIIVNEFSNKNIKGPVRGSTPGNYVIRYMAREDASEGLTPVRLKSTDTFITRYMLRSDAVEDLSENVPNIKRNFKHLEKYGGKAFGNNDISLSHEDLLKSSRELQKLYDDGKTIMRTVISFDEDYLAKYNLLKDNFVHQHRGDFKGNLDQLKLRQAIMDGLTKMSKEFDDLKYVGVIQIDTDNVHCHLAMADAGVGYLMPDKTQRGKLKSRHKHLLRQGIDRSLDESQRLKYLSSNVDMDKRNGKCFIKKFTHNLMNDRSFFQFLVACLPEDKRLWRASTNRKEMKKANTITKLYVENVFEKYPEVYERAKNSIEEYADIRTNVEGLSNSERLKLIQVGKNNLINDCINSVYRVVEQIDNNDKKVRTPILDTMSMDYSSLYDKRKDGNNDLIEFSFKLRTFSNRLKYHKKEAKKYNDAIKMFDSKKSVDEAKVIRDFYEIEKEYNSKCVGKYYHFLDFLPSDENYDDEFNDLINYSDRINNLKNMVSDKTFNRLDTTSAEKYGIDVYNQRGGNYVKYNKDILYERIDRMSSTFKDRLSDFVDKISLDNLVINGDKIEKGSLYDFDDVKSVDIHNLSFDWINDVNISIRNVNNFQDMAHRRYEAYKNACDYLISTNQSHMIQYFNGSDIEHMKKISDKLDVLPVLEVERPDGASYIRSKTLSLDSDYQDDVEIILKNVIEDASHRFD